MSVREVASAEFYELSRRAEGKLLVVQFTATWCGPCRRVAPQYEALARRTPDVEFVKVYEHNSRDAIIASGVRSFPTFQFYLGGGKVDECRGANIQAVEQKAMQHKGAASAAGGPVVVKLRFELQKPRESGQGFVLVSQEADIEVHPSEGLEIFKFQVLSITDIETDDQALAAGDSDAPIDSDTSLTAALRRTGGGVYGNYPVIRVTRRAANTGRAGNGGISARGTEAKGKQATTDTPEWDGCCSKTYFGKRPVIQPAYVIREESLLPKADLTNLQKKKAGPEAILVVCKACAENCFVPGRAEHSPAISVSVAFVCQSKEACSKGYGSDLFSGRADAGAEVYPPSSSAATAAEAAAAAAADRVYFAARGLPATGGDNKEMAELRRRVSNGITGVLTYEDAALQAKARAVLPPEGGDGSIAQKAAEIAAEGGLSEQEGLARALLSWFKKDFFTWTNKPPCSGCGSRGPSMVGKGGGTPTPEEARAGASTVELYDCQNCGVQTRFPRYNDAGKLLETRNGRCGEWANCFTLMCRAIGLEARHVVDWTDHVWTEIWIPARNKWVHADPCENKLDKPLMYEHGWNKRLSYIIAFDRNGAVDVTRRYTGRWLQVLSRRNSVPEKWLAGVLAGSSAAMTPSVAARLAEEQRELKGFESRSGDGDVLDSEEMEGRQSGDAEWVASRGEGGGGASMSAGSDLGARLKSHAASPLVGAPLGVLQPGGGLALCVAAVVERTGDASVLVGGAAVSRLSGRGRGALCAAALSAATGVLLDTKNFVLGSEIDSAAVTAWLTSLPDGAVVGIAAGGGAIAVASLEDGLAEKIASLIGGGSGALGGGGNAMPGDRKSTAFTLVGWKGTDAQRWVRRQHRSARNDGRCAVYAELVTSPPLALNHAPKPTQIELKDKLCLCPLRSQQPQAAKAAVVPADAPSVGISAISPSTLLAGEGATFPIRGECYRAGEQSVLVGPTVDIVDCAGWTTVLQVPQTVGDTGGVTDGEEEKVLTLAAWRVASVYPAVGGWHDDTEGFDDAAIGYPSFVMGGSPVPMPDGTVFIPTGRVREIIGWSGDNVNGVQVVYDVGGKAIRAPKHMGEHGLYRQSSIVLDVAGGEVLTEISVKAGSLLDSLHVRTSKGREKKWGGNGGEFQQTWRVPPGSSFLGFNGGVGGHIHALGVTLIENGAQEKVQPRSEEDVSVSSAPLGWTSLPVLSSVITASLYSADPVARACGQMLAFSASPAVGKENPVTASPGASEVATALETMRKYADNLLASPLDPKVSRIRLANGFFTRKIGKLPGGGGVIRAMGFELADEGGQMHYVFRREGAGGGLGGLRRARQTLTDILATLKPTSA